MVKKDKCNIRTMGKKFGKLMKGIAAVMSALEQDQIELLEKQGWLNVDVEGQSVTVESADVDIISEDIPGWLVSNEGNLTVALEVELNDDLRNEGMARELINRVQNMRKEAGFEITDRICVYVSHNDAMEKAIDNYSDYIKGQVLADNIEVSDDNRGTEVEFDDFKLYIDVVKS